MARAPHWLDTPYSACHYPHSRRVADTHTPKLLATKLDLLVECLQQNFGLETKNCDRGFKISGELGQLGQEEQEWLIPWLQQERCDRPQLQLADSTRQHVGKGQVKLGTVRLAFQLPTMLI